MSFAINFYQLAGWQLWLLWLTWFVCLLGASHLTHRWLFKSQLGSLYRLAIAPGVIWHELAHATMVVLTGNQLLEVNFWSAEGGYVRHRNRYQGLLAALTNFLIALAPLPLTLIAWWLIYQRLDDLAIWQLVIVGYFSVISLATLAPSSTDWRVGIEFSSLILIIGSLLSFSPLGQELFARSVPNLEFVWLWTLKTVLPVMLVMGGLSRLFPRR